ncbi:hypothetical protein BsWGS_10558 [Bradybaena similaris]
MVVKKSEYQKQYKACTIKKHQAVYLENLNLRLQRRDREFLHTPICWEETSEEDISSDCSEEQSKPKIQAHKEPEYQSLADILSDSKRKAESARRQKFLEGFKRPSDIVNGITEDGNQLSNTDVPTKVHDTEEKKQNEAGGSNTTVKKEYLATKLNVSVTDENVRSNLKPALTHTVVQDGNKRDISEDRNHDVSPSDGLLKEAKKLYAGNKRTKTKQKNSKELEGFSKIKPPSAVDRHCYSSRPSSIIADSSVPHLSYISRVRKPRSQPHIPRIKSAPASPEPLLKERPPFLAYGIGDKEDNLATHRTHNVRASVDVYPPALRAKSRREEQHRRQVEKIHKAGSADAMLEKLSAPAPDLAGWESEYRKQFHGYQPRDYEKAVASHAVIPRASSVRAVHRGGCLLVHVD